MNLDIWIFFNIWTTAPSDPCRGCWHETGRKPILWPGNGHEFVEVGWVSALCGYHYQWFWLLSVPPHSSPSLSFSSPSSSGTGHRPGVSDMAPWASPAFPDHKWTPLSICIHLISPACKAARVWGQSAGPARAPKAAGLGPEIPVYLRWVSRNTQGAVVKLTHQHCSAPGRMAPALRRTHQNEACA